MTESNPYHYEMRDQRTIDTLTDEVRFRDVLQLARSVCLPREFEHEPYRPELTPNERVVAALGATGLRTALDSSKDFSILSPPTDDSRTRGLTRENEEYIFADTPLRKPHAFSDTPDLHLAHEAKQFGQDLLRDAYRCLGHDVHDQIKAFQAASTDEERKDILAWVGNRLHAISAADKSLDRAADIADDYYHPVRLSPKALGIYPNTHTSPTCLSVGMMTASFLEQAGAQHLHGGVMATQKCNELSSLAYNLYETRTYVENNFSSHHQSDFLLSYTTREEEDTIVSAFAPESFHSANLVRLEENWVVFDANFNVLESYGEEDSAQLDTIYHNLHEFERSAPGLELTFKSTEIICLNAAKIPFETTQPYLPETDRLAIVLQEETEALPTKLYDVSAEQFRDIITHGSYSNDTQRDAYIKAFDDIGYDLFYAYLHSHVLHGDSIEAMQQRAQTDSAFLQRRVEDLQGAWDFMLIALQTHSGYIVASQQLRAAHPMLEVGLPDQRIGFSVVKEFDTYCEGGVSPSFWLSNWSSHIAKINAIAEDSQRPGQRTITGATALALEDSSLQYSKDFVIINEFTSETLTDQGETDDQIQCQEAAEADR